MLNKLLSLMTMAMLVVLASGLLASPVVAADRPEGAVENSKAFNDAVKSGDAAWQAQDFDRAIYHYVQAMNNSPHDAATLAKIGTIEDGRGHSDLAEKAFFLAHGRPRHVASLRSGRLRPPQPFRQVAGARARP